MPALLIIPFVMLIALIREISDMLKKPEYRALLIWVVAILATGTVFFKFAEGWTWLDALYFSVITLATVGYGDLTPTTPLSKAMTILFVFLGVSFLLAFVNLLARDRIQVFAERRGDKALEEKFDEDIN